MPNVYLPDPVDTSIGNPVQSSWGSEMRVALEAAAPAGVICSFVGDVAPDGWLTMIGQTVSNFQALYPIAWSRIPTSWKIGGNVKFPDTRARVMIGAAGYGDVILGVTGGLNEASLQIANLPVHSHGGYTNTVTQDHEHGFTTGNENANHTHGFTTGGMGHELVKRKSGGENGFWTGINNDWPNPYLDIAGDSPLPWPKVWAGMAVDYIGDHVHAGSTAGISANHQHSGTTGGINRNHQHQVYSEGSGAAVSRMQAHVAVTFIIRVY